MNLIPPRAIIPPIHPGDLAPLPKLTVFPERVTTPPIWTDLYDERSTGAVMTSLIAKVQAEDARMRRLLPEAPAGLYWECEVQSSEPDYDFARNSADMLVRLVYRLKLIGER